MRKIAFRAWDSFNEEMIRSDDRGLDRFFYSCQLREDANNGIHIMQFIGLHDEKGVEIYEGDKINHGLFGGGVIEFNEVTCAFECSWSNGQRYDITHCRKGQIIGNVYQNPELIK